MAAAPAPCGLPAFDPLRVGGSGHRLRRALLRRRRVMAAGLAVTAAALAASGAGGAGAAAGTAPGADERAEAAARAVSGTGSGSGASGGSGVGADAADRPGTERAESVRAPVRIADVATVRLLRAGDRVDVIAAPDRSPGDQDADARVLATNVPVESVPRIPEGADGGGALVLLRVTREVAAELAGASATSRLAVTLC